MAAQNWYTAPVVGNATVQDLVRGGVNAFDTYQKGEAGKDSINEIVKGYDQGINVVTDSANESKGVLGDVYDTTRQDIDPYLEAGKSSLDSYMGLMDDPSSIKDDPGYQFRFDTGMEAVQRNLEGAGYADPMGSGANPIGITEYAQGFATEELDRALDRRIPIIGKGSEATRTGMMSGDSYARGIASVNEAFGRDMAALYNGRANVQATKYAIDAMTMNGYLQGASGLFQAAGDPTFGDVLSAALGGATAADGTSLWSMLADSFGFDGEDDGILSQAMDWVTGGGGDAGAEVFGAPEGWEELGIPEGADWGGLVNESISAIPEAAELFSGVDWGNIFSTGGGMTSGADIFGSSTMGGAEAFGAPSGWAELGTGSTATAAPSSTISSFFSGASGAAIAGGGIAAVISLFQGEGTGVAAAKGGGAAAGAAAGFAVGGPIGAVIGGALGSFAGGALGKAIGISPRGGGEDKADYSLVNSSGGGGRASGIKASSEWASDFGFGHNKHISIPNAEWQKALDAVAMTDDLVGQELTPEENQAMKDYLSGPGGQVGSNSNEGGFNPGRMAGQFFDNRNGALQKVLSPERYAELEIGKLYSSLKG